jgi:hypothetical protein
MGTWTILSSIPWWKSNNGNIGKFPWMDNYDWYIYIGKPLVSCCTLTITIFFNHIHMQIMILGLIWWVDNWDMGCIGLIWWLSGKRMGILMVKLMAIRWDSIGEWMGTEGIYIMGFHMDIYTHIHLHIHVYIYTYIYTINSQAMTFAVGGSLLTPWCYYFSRYS